MEDFFLPPGFETWSPGTKATLNPLQYWPSLGGHLFDHKLRSIFKSYLHIMMTNSESVDSENSKNSKKGSKNSKHKLLFKGFSIGLFYIFFQTQNYSLLLITF